MKILVTGARGAIGCEVVAEASTRGEDVYGLGHGQWLDDQKLPAIKGWLNGDITAENLDTICKMMRKDEDDCVPDIIIHLAGGSHVGTSIDHPMLDFSKTVVAAQNLLDWMRNQAPQCALVIASSAAVYGNASSSPIPETCPSLPTSPYGTHKAIVEMLARSYACQYKLKIAILRLFSVYGSGLQKQLVFELLQRIQNGETEIILGGTGQEQRDFIYIADAAAMLLDCADLASIDAPVFNGATGIGITIQELANSMLEGIENAKIEFSGVSREGDPCKLVGDITLARAAGLRAPTSWNDGLIATRKWMLQRAYGA